MSNVFNWPDSGHTALKRACRAIHRNGADLIWAGAVTCQASVQRRLKQTLMKHLSWTARTSVFEQGLITADMKDSSAFGAFLLSHVTQLLGFPILKSYQHILDPHIFKLAFPHMLAAQPVTNQTRRSLSCPRTLWHAARKTEIEPRTPWLVCIERVDLFAGS